MSVRMLTVWCPDWPVVAWGIPLDEPAVVVVANRVVASSPAARREGVARGQRRRDAQGRCPDVAVLERDLDREVRLFEPVAAALEALTPRIEVVEAGLVGFPTRGPSRFFGGDEALIERVTAAVEPVLARRVVPGIGVADGTFASRLAAEAAAGEAAADWTGPVLVPPGESGRFLADLPITTLDRPELTDVLLRLGLPTLGAFGSLAPADVVGRFGREGAEAHRLARGDDRHPPDLRRPAADLAVTWMFEPPAERIDRCAFAAKALADELHATLAGQGLACVRVGIEAETDDGEQHLRLWRHEGTLSAAALADRARWQLDGWLGEAARRRAVAEAGRGDPTAAGVDPDPLDEANAAGHGIRRLTLVPDEVVPAVGRQLGLWGGRAERADDVTRVVARLQVELGPEGVSVPEWQGGRGPGDRIRLVPAAAVDLGEERPAAADGWIDQPWPGHLPRPSPARVAIDPTPVEVLDAAGRPVTVSGRGEVSSPPDAITVLDASAAPGGRRRRVVAWAGPWPAEERWWDPVTLRRRARMQVVIDDGSAHLLSIEGGTWSVEASYR